MSLEKVIAIVYEMKARGNAHNGGWKKRITRNCNDMIAAVRAHASQNSDGILDMSQESSNKARSKTIDIILEFRIKARTLPQASAGAISS